MRKFLVCLLFVPLVAHAEFFTGNQLLSLLQSREMWDRMQGLGYIQGVFDAHMGVTICPPSGVNAGQVQDMVRNYLDNIPATRNRSADLIIRDALRSVWPCANNRPSRGA